MPLINGNASMIIKELEDKIKKIKCKSGCEEYFSILSNADIPDDATDQELLDFSGFIINGAIDFTDFGKGEDAIKLADKALEKIDNRFDESKCFNNKYAATILFNKAQAYFAKFNGSAGGSYINFYTDDNLLKAQRYYHLILKHRESFSDSKAFPSAMINLGQSYSFQNRWAEALSCFIEASRYDQSNEIAIYSLGNAYLHSYQYCKSPYCVLFAKALAKYLSQERAFTLSSNIQNFINSKANYGNSLAVFQNLLSKSDDIQLHDVLPHSSKKASDFQNFIWKNSLGLNLCQGCFDDNPRALDRYFCGDHVELKLASKDEENKVIHRNFGIFTMLNEAINIFQLGRLELFLSLNHGYMEKFNCGFSGMDFKGYQMKPSIENGFLLSSIGNFYSSLHKIAFFLNEFLGVNLNRDGVSFNKVMKKVAEMGDEALMKKSPLNALFHTAMSFSKNGEYEWFREMRNQLEHRCFDYFDGDLALRKTSESCGPILFDGYEHILIRDIALEIGKICRDIFLYCFAYLNQVFYIQPKYIGCDELLQRIRIEYF